jgi:hypothetical protein
MGAARPEVATNITQNNPITIANTTFFLSMFLPPFLVFDPTSQTAPLQYFPGKRLEALYGERPHPAYFGSVFFFRAV